MSGLEREDQIDACWSRIGVDGDRSCAELVQVIHCRNCAVFARAGKRVLDQQSPGDYLEQWAERLAATEEAEDPDTLSIVIFRIAGESLALPTASFVEALEVRPIHAIPHRTRPGLLGLVNVRGELQLCASLAALLGIEAEASGAAAARSARPRIAVIERAGERWAFPVDEIRGLRRIAQRELSAPPASVTIESSALTRALFALDGERVALLDADLLLSRLAREVLQ